MIRAFQWDLARQVERIDWLLAQLPRYAEWGYNELYLHLEDAVEYPSLPAVARPDAYTYQELGQLVNAATRVGIKVVPIVNLLGHTQYLIKVPELRDLNELRAADGSPLERGQICPLHPRTLEIAEKLLRDIAPFCTAGKVHVGLDESFHLGKHPLSRKEIARVGLAAHFAGHVNRLHAVTRPLGLRMGMWADMLYFLPGAIPLLPRDLIAYEWYYYPFTRRPRVELFNFSESDVGERLRARGIEYWGCPMNGAFRYEPLPHFTDRLDNIVSWWRHGQRMQAAGFLVTSWEPNRLAMELTTVVDASAASLWLEPATNDPRAMLERGFARVFGKKNAKQAARVSLACDRFPFSGYPRWQINSRWDSVSRREPVTAYRREEKFFAALARQAKRTPAPLRASVELRHYLAARDVYVREGGQRPRLPAALRAAGEMWKRTRDPRVAGPNEEIIRADAGRKTSAGWQLCYRVENFAPAAQLVAVEQQRDDGSWETVQSCHTIEFQARAARPRGGLTREHAAPVAWNGDAKNLPRLRFALRGLGQVRIGDVELVGPGGSATKRGLLRKKILGRPPPRSGFPSLDWTKNQATLPVAFRKK
ncbi:MAG TPA: family 20 glycosylhydrolase [Opitutaceae bacterium]|nr:family 20 glycosylhydrolase [Opitutaceae bacterium]